MKELNNKQLLEIKGSGIKLGLMFLIGTAISFTFGIVDGYVRPLKCRK